MGCRVVKIQSAGRKGEKMKSFNELKREYDEAKKRLEKIPEPKPLTSLEIAKFEASSKAVSAKCEALGAKAAAVGKELEKLKVNLGEAVYAGADAQKLGDEIAALERKLNALDAGVVVAQGKLRQEMGYLNAAKDAERVRRAEVERRAAAHEKEKRQVA